MTEEQTIAFYSVFLLIIFLPLLFEERKNLTTWRLVLTIMIMFHVYVLKEL